MVPSDGIGRRTLLSGLATLGAGAVAGRGVDRASARTDRSLWTWDLHRETTRIACEQMGVGPVDRTVATAATVAPDDWDCGCDPDAVADDLVPEWAPESVERDVAYVVEQLPHSYGQYYNPGYEVSAWGYTVDVGGFGNAPDNARRYATRARDRSGHGRWRQFGYAAHFLVDVGQPLHTGEEFDQATNEWVHHSYERGIGSLWPELEAAFRGDGDARDVEDPEAATKDLARVAHERSERVFSLVYDTPDWERDPEVRAELLSLTRECLRPTGRYLRGLLEWVREDEDGDGGGDGGDSDDDGWWPPW
jgi:hypothetical protein